MGHGDIDGKPLARQNLVHQPWHPTILHLAFATLSLVLSVFVLLGPEPAFGRLGLVGSLGGYTYYMYTSHASPRACGARLGRIMQERPCARLTL